MPPPKPETPAFLLIEYGPEHVRQVVRHVLRHLDQETIEAVSDSIARAIESQGMRFAGAQVFLDSSPNRRDLAAAYLLEYPGRLASLVGPWVDRSCHEASSSEAVTRMLNAIVQHARRWDVELVQAVIDDDSPFEAEALRSIGLRRLSSLYQMAVDVPAVHDSILERTVSTTTRCKLASPVDDYLRWKRYASEDAALWVKWLDATYKQTSDCPELNGLRTTARTLEGYLASSGTRPERLESPEWWAAFDVRNSSQNAGMDQDKIACAFLLSDSGGGFWELSYMGVAPEYRGYGLGSETLHRALVHAQSLDAKRLTLAVDCRNSIAIRLYQMYGFQQIRQLEAWFLAFQR